MNALVVHAHPHPGSFNHALTARAIAGLRSAGHSVEVIDLYGIGYRATLSCEEHVAYSSDEPILDETVRHHAQLLSDCDILVFVYPTWWSAQPAILKGWIERTFVPGVAFSLDPLRSTVIPRLSRIRRIVGITTHGSPWWYVKMVNDNGRRTCERTLRASTGLRTRSTWLALYALDGTSNSRRKTFLDKVEQTMANLA